MLQYDAGVETNENWIVYENEFNAQLLGKCETIMALGNGYMGLRSSMEESYPKQTRNLFVAGTYNHFDQYEPVELPNAADVVEHEILFNGEMFTLEKGTIHTYQRYLNLRTGELVRKIRWESEKGEKYDLCFRRFVSLKNQHLIGMKVEITPLSTETSIQLSSGINGQMTNSGVQHFHDEEKRIFDRKILQLIQTTTESKVDFIMSAAHICKVEDDRQPLDPGMSIDRRKVNVSFNFNVPTNKTLTVEKIISVHTSRDKHPEDESYKFETIRRQSHEELTLEAEKGYDELFQESCRKWEKYWNHVNVEIESENPFDQLTIRFAQYHMYIMAPSHDARFGIGAKGLTGEGYKGHSFWDSEIFILPYFLYTNPSIARSLLEYRYHTLDEARKKAQDHGYKGAMYPWESAFTGEEETPEWAAVNIQTGKPTKVWSGLIEQHITADVAYAIWQYYCVTGDDDFMKKYGSEMLFETATFWTSRLEWDEDRQYYTINHVIGPDEYKEHVNNNAFTNYMALFNIQTAMRFYDECKKEMKGVYERLIKKYNIDQQYEQWKRVVNEIYLPKPREADGIIPQDDTYLSKPVLDLTKYKNVSSVQTILQNYSREQVIDLQVSKQADIVMLLYLMNNRFSKQIKKLNWSYYENKTIHDSSLSMAVHSIVASDIGDTDTAYDCFQKACRIDLGRNMKSSDAGIHAASLGGIWKSVVFGFGGIRNNQGVLQFNPALPEPWKRLKFSIDWKTTRFEIEITHERIKIKNLKKTRGMPEVEIQGTTYEVKEDLELNYKYTRN